VSENVYSRRAAATLIVSNDAMIAALLGAAIELAGFRAEFIRADEDVLGALSRSKPSHLLVDCECDAVRSEALLGRALMSGTRIFVFGSSRRLENTRDIAATYQARFISLPEDITRIREILARRQSPSPERAPTNH
jgi:DNA-binding NtrC family response regulator